MRNCVKRSLLVVAICCVLMFSAKGVFAKEMITVVDSEGFAVMVELPIKRIVCISSAINEILFALGVGDLVVGRDETSEYPPALQQIPVVAGSSYRPQIEAIVDLEPDLVVADTMLQDEARKKFNSFGIPTIAERASEEGNLFNVIRRLAKLTGREEKGEELITFISTYQNLIAERLKNLADEERIRVYWEWKQSYKTASSKASVHSRIVQAGGVNIGAETDGTYPQVSSEFVMEQNPEVIIRMESRGISVVQLAESLKEVVNRTGLQGTDAVQNHRVYVMTWDVLNGLPSIVGSLYYAKILHPELFADIDPEAIYTDLLERFFNTQKTNQVIYPAM